MERACPLWVNLDILPYFPHVRFSPDSDWKSRHSGMAEKVPLTTVCTAEKQRAFLSVEPL